MGATFPSLLKIAPHILIYLWALRWGKGRSAQQRRERIEIFQTVREELRLGEEGIFVSLVTGSAGGVSVHVLLEEKKKEQVGWGGGCCC